MNPQQRIEAEYDETLLDVLLGYAEQGESITATRKPLEINYNTMRRWVDKFGIRDQFKPRGLCNGAREAIEYRSVDSKALSVNKRRNMLDTYGFEFEGIIDTRSGHACRKGINISTVRHRLARGWSIDRALTARVLTR